MRRLHFRLVSFHPRIFLALFIALRYHRGTMKRILPLLCCCLLLASCAGTINFTVRTSPEGADIAINGKPVGKSPLTLEVEQTKTLGIVAHKDGYELGSATVPTKPNWFLSILWTKTDPKAQVLEKDSVHINMKKIPSAADFKPVPLPAFAPPAGVFPERESEAPALRPLPSL